MNRDRTAIQRVAVTGGTGFVGRAIVSHLCELGYEVVCFSRDPASASRSLPAGASAVGWLRDEATTGRLLEGIDAVIHLAGAQAVGARLSTARKKLVMESRVDSTRLLVSEMKKCARPPAVFVCASAVGFYGPRDPDETLDESAPSGDDFLAQVCINWEHEARAAEALGVRVISTRLGIVLGAGGGPLSVMALPFRWMVGGPIAGGKQAVSWVDVRDVARAFAFCLAEHDLSGPVNLCAPTPVTNGELSREIAHVLGRPDWMPVPALALRLLLSEGANPITQGQRVSPRALLARGFKFEHADLRRCLVAHLRGG